MGTTEDFFAERKEQSRVKTAIVTKYFEAWAKVIIGVQNKYPDRSEGKVGYVDLFAGPGAYKDDTPSTPLEVLRIAVANQKIRERLVMYLNDSNSEFAAELENKLSSAEGAETLKYSPIIVVNEVGGEVADWLENNSLIPSLVFLDPWGYKGLTLKLISASLKDWGSDCITFFNYNRINMALHNPNAQDEMVVLFGEDALSQLRRDLVGLSPNERETQVIEAFCRVLKGSTPAKYLLPFRFVDDRGRRTSHHIIFATKHFRGYEIMKDIMARESTTSEQGVPTFEYNPVEERMAYKQPLLFQLSRPLDQLGEMLLEEYAGRELKVRSIYEEHSVDRPYIKKNYKRVLLSLEEQSRISVSQHRKGTMGDDNVVAFPPRTGDKHGG